MISSHVFFGEDALAVSLLDRINNEFSHLAGAIERSTSPVDVPEMKTAANFILKTIKEKDPDQYEALLESIGESKKWRALTKDTCKRFYICIQIVFVIVQVVIKPE